MTPLQMKLEFQVSSLSKWGDIFWIKREMRRPRNKYKEHAEFKKYHRYNGTHKN